MGGLATPAPVASRAANRCVDRLTAFEPRHRGCGDLAAACPSKAQGGLTPGGSSGRPRGRMNSASNCGVADDEGIGTRAPIRCLILCPTWSWLTRGRAVDRRLIRARVLGGGLALAQVAEDAASAARIGVAMIEPMIPASTPPATTPRRITIRSSPGRPVGCFSLPVWPIVSAVRRGEKSSSRLARRAGNGR